MLWRRSHAAAEVSRAWERLDEIEEYRQLCRVRLDQTVPVREPLVLNSQVARSGGTLLSQLFDGHPECHAHPHELRIGAAGTRGSPWPRLDLERPESWFAALFEQDSAEHFAAGYSRPPQVEVFPFVFLVGLQKQIFDACISARSIESERDVYDCYFTSYFNAWLDYQNLYSGPKRIVTGFMPRSNVELESVGRFFVDYPDGWFVALVREPRAWFASASRHRKRYEDVDAALGVWRRSTETICEARRRFGERVIVLTYEKLVLETEATMGLLADRLGISMSPILLVPTFNGRMIRANSTSQREVEAYGVLADRTEAYRDLLDADTTARVDELSGDLYDRASAAMLSIP